MGGNRVKFPLLIHTADKSSTAQPPTAFSAARAHTGPSSACLQKGGIVLLCSAPLMLPSWKKLYLYWVADDKSSQSMHWQGHRDWSWEGAHRVSWRHRGCMSFSSASFHPGGTNTTGRLASDFELNEPLKPSYSYQQCPTKLQSFKVSSPSRTPIYLLPPDQEICFHHNLLGLFQHNWVYFQPLHKWKLAGLIKG